jgi:hypothetical protein
MHDDRRDRRGSEKLPGEEPETERELGERDGEGERKKDRVRKRRVGLQDVGEARDVQELAGR